MKLLYKLSGDFEVIIRIFPTGEGGRQTLAYNGIRWNFCYADDLPENNQYMIWPDFYDEHGDSLPTDQPLPTDTYLPARMIILVEEMRERIHRSRIHEGVRFFCVEGNHRVAEGIVTRITGLFQERPA